MIKTLIWYVHNQMMNVRVVESMIFKLLLFQWEWSFRYTFSCLCPAPINTNMHIRL